MLQNREQVFERIINNIDRFIGKSDEDFDSIFQYLFNNETFAIAQNLELKANEFVLINKPKFDDDIYCVLPIYIITPHTEISFGYLKIKRDFGIGSTIVVLNNYKQKTNNNAHRIILG